MYGGVFVGLPYNPEDPYTSQGNGQGLVAVKSLYDAQAIYSESGLPDEDDIQRRIIEHYDPFHDTLEKQVESNLSKFGYNLVYDVHSMPSIGTSFESDKDKARPDIIIGNNHFLSGSTPLSMIAYQLAKDFRLSVRMNEPYFGGFITQRYARLPTKSYRDETFGDRGSESIQVEFNRRSIGLDEETLELVDPEAFSYFQTYNTTLMQRFSEYVREKVHHDHP